MFITLEGPDGSGKSTLAALLADYLLTRGVPVVATREPGGTTTGAKIRHMLLNPDLALSSNAELLLFLADRAQHIHEVIMPALRAGAVVVCDRYADSTVAYQGHGRDRLVWLRAIPKGLLYPLMPDLTIILDVDPATAASRVAERAGKPNRLDNETLRFRQAVRSGFLTIAAGNPKRCRVVDASRSEKLVAGEVLELVTRALDACRQQKGRVYGPRPFGVCNEPLV